MTVSPTAKVAASSLAGLEAELQRALEIEEEVAAEVWDMDFGSWVQLHSFRDLPDRAKIQESVPCFPCSPCSIASLPVCTALCTYSRSCSHHRLSKRATSRLPRPRSKANRRHRPRPRPWPRPQPRHRFSTQRMLSTRSSPGGRRQSARCAAFKTSAARPLAGSAGANIRRENIAAFRR